jgi:hypothetical protein
MSSGGNSGMTFVEWVVYMVLGSIFMFFFNSCKSQMYDEPRILISTDASMRTYVSAHFSEMAQQQTRITCVDGADSLARCAANVLLPNGQSKFVEAECGMTKGNAGCGPMSSRH